MSWSELLSASPVAGKWSEIMVRVNARYAQGQLVLEQPLDLPEGAEVTIDIHQVETDEQQAWELACSRLEAEWDLADSSYDDWRKLYAVSPRRGPGAK